jgi:hypothetical protein
VERVVVHEVPIPIEKLVLKEVPVTVDKARPAPRAPRPASAPRAPRRPVAPRALAVTRAHAADRCEGGAAGCAC